MTKNTDWYRAYTHFRISDDLAEIFEEENLKTVLDIAFNSPSINDQEPDLTVEDMHQILNDMKKE